MFLLDLGFEYQNPKANFCSISRIFSLRGYGPEGRLTYLLTYTSRLQTLERPSQSRKLKAEMHRIGQHDLQLYISVTFAVRLPCNVTHVTLFYCPGLLLALFLTGEHDKNSD